MFSVFVRETNMRTDDFKKEKMANMNGEEEKRQMLEYRKSLDEARSRVILFLKFACHWMKSTNILPLSTETCTWPEPCSQTETDEKYRSYGGDC